MEKTHLTPRQKQVLQEVCRGKSNKEIARILNMAEATVKLHLTEIFRVLGVRNRNHAVIRAADFSIHTPEMLKELSDEEILTEFANVAFTSRKADWPTRVIMFGRALIKRAKEK